MSDNTNQSGLDKTQDQSNGGNICSVFAITRFCQFGDQCRFSHDVDAASNASSSSPSPKIYEAQPGSYEAHLDSLPIDADFTVPVSSDWIRKKTQKEFGKSCTSCRTMLPPKARFCSTCGTKVETRLTPTTMNAPASPSASSITSTNTSTTKESERLPMGLSDLSPVPPMPMIGNAQSVSTLSMLTNPTPSQAEVDDITDPTDQAVDAYATQMGLDGTKHRRLLWIARQALIAERKAALTGQPVVAGSLNAATPSMVPAFSKPPTTEAVKARPAANDTPQPKAKVAESDGNENVTGAAGNSSEVLDLMRAVFGAEVVNAALPAGNSTKADKKEGQPSQPPASPQAPASGAAAKPSGFQLRADAPAFMPASAKAAEAVETWTTKPPKTAKPATTAAGGPGEGASAINPGTYQKLLVDLLGQLKSTTNKPEGASQAASKLATQLAGQLASTTPDSSGKTESSPTRPSWASIAAGTSAFDTKATRRSSNSQNAAATAALDNLAKASGIGDKDPAMTTLLNHVQRMNHVQTMMNKAVAKPAAQVSQQTGPASAPPKPAAAPPIISRNPNHDSDGSDSDEPMSPAPAPAKPAAMGSIPHPTARSSWEEIEAWHKMIEEAAKNNATGARPRQAGQTSQARSKSSTMAPTPGAAKLSPAPKPSAAVGKPGSESKPAGPSLSNKAAETKSGFSDSLSSLEAELQRYEAEQLALTMQELMGGDL